MDTIFHIFHHAQYTRDGTVLGNLLSPIPPAGDPSLLQRFYRDSNVFDIQSDITQYIKSPQTTLPKEQRNAWIDIYVAYWKALGEIIRAESGNHRNDWAIKVYEAWKEVMNLVIRGYGSAGFQSWTLPVLYTAGKYLRVFAIKADEEQAAKVGNGAVKMDNDGIGDDIASGGFEKNERLEDAARVINRVFTLCISDRSPMEESRKWGLYHTTNLLFKTYFKLNSISLSKNCLRAIEASAIDMPPMSDFPKAHVVTFRYYVGVIHFLDEEYHKAEDNLTAAYRMCHRDAQSNKNLILTYLVPTYLHTTRRLPNINNFHGTIVDSLFGQLLSAIHYGALGWFTMALDTESDVYVKRRIYLSLERSRELCLRNLLKKCWILNGDREKPRVKVKEWAAAVRWSSKSIGEGGYSQIPQFVFDKGHQDMEDFVEEVKEKREAGERFDSEMDDDEVECLISGLIYKGLLKGYISREHGIIVLNRKGEIFPGTGV